MRSQEGDIYALLLTTDDAENKALFADIGQRRNNVDSCLEALAKANLDAAQAQVDVIKAQQAEAEGQLQELRAALARAVRDLSFTTVRAPVDGIFSNRIVNEVPGVNRILYDVTS